MRVQELIALIVALGISAVAVSLSAQQSAGSTATPAQIEAGKKMFVQRCSVCHLPPLGPGDPKPYARLLNGYVKPETEAVARSIIQKGIPTRMPGFQFGLAPGEIDRIIAYLSTLK